MTTAAAHPAVHAAAPSLWQNRGFLIFLGGRFVSRAGDALFSLASVWLVLDLTGNNALAGGTAAALEFVPYLLVGLLGGVLADRWDRRRTMAAADLVRGVLLLVIPVLAAAGALAVWHIFMLIFALSCLGRLFSPARQALVPEIVEHGQIVRANALVEGSGQAAWVLGAAVGGVLVSVVGAANVFYIDAATFFCSAVTLLLIHPRFRQAVSPRHGIWKEAVHGVRYVRDTPVLAAGVLVSLVGVAAFAPVTVLLPVLVRRELDGGSRAFGVLMALFFVGSVAGSALVGKIGRRLHRGRTIIAGMGVLGVAIAGVGLSPSPAVAGSMLLLLGGVAAAYNVAQVSLRQQETPPELRGRVFAVAEMISQAARPLALLVAGGVASLIDVRTTLVLLAALAGVAAVMGAMHPALRQTR